MRSMYLPLVAGAESEERMDAILAIQRFSSPHKAALKDIYVRGWPIGIAAREHGLESENVSRNVSKLDKLNRLIHKFNVS